MLDSGADTFGLTVICCITPFTPIRECTASWAAALLVLRVDFALKVNPAVAHHDVDPIMRHRCLPLQSVKGRRAISASVAAARQPELDIVGDRLDPLHPLAAARLPVSRRSSARARSVSQHRRGP